MKRMIKMPSDAFFNDPFGFAVVVFFMIVTIAYLVYVVRNTKEDDEDAEKTF